MKSSKPETWKPIEGWPYEASNLGQVRRVGSRVLSPGRVTRRHGDRTYTYLIVNLSKGGRFKTFYVHRLVLRAFVGSCPPGHECCHKNGNSLDNRLPNLRWGTHKQNGEDSARLGTAAKGERVGTAKLRTEDVIKIRRRYQAGESCPKIALDYGCHKANIWLVASGRTWRHLREEFEK